MPTAGARGLSLWLRPEAETSQRLAAWIARLVARHRTETFAPHLTLLGAVELAEPAARRAAGRAAIEIAPLLVSPEEIQARDEHFRCLFVRARGDRAILFAHAIAARAFGREPDPAFLPHLSLVYGTLAPEEKRAIAREIGDELSRPFEMQRLELWRTEGPVAEWRELAAFDLGRASRSR
jgi:2'-5' RNA ligase